jgi:NAD(P)H-hydrate epimerase
MSQLPIVIHTAEQVRAIDRFAIEKLGIAGYTLMTRAGAAALRILRTRWPSAHRVVVVCGSGNNAGDGYVLARLARQTGLNVDVISLFDLGKLQGDALTALREYQTAGGQVVESLANADTLGQADVIVDAIFGTGLSRSLDASLIAQVHTMNSASTPILALDIPTGLDANTGHVLGAAIKADCTMTFVGLKLGLYLGQALDYSGQIEFDALDIDPAELRSDCVAERLDLSWLKSVLRPRSRLSHKGTNGHVLIIGGGLGMAGAVRLTGEACLRVGAGLVTVVTHSQNVSAVVMERPELIVRGVDQVDELHALIARADVIAIGPGLGQDAWAKSLLNAAITSRKPLVVDADALNLLATNPQKCDHWILTPHPGEAGRLLGVSTSAIQEDRLGSVQALVRRYGGIAILKGACSICVDGLGTDGVAMPAICDRGNPGMATPGMGDVLTGVVAGLFAQLDDAWVAARAGMFAHALAGDMAAAQLGAEVERGLIASDLFAQLPVCVNPQ